MKRASVVGIARILGALACTLAIAFGLPCQAHAALVAGQAQGTEQAGCSTQAAGGALVAKAYTIRADLDVKANTLDLSVIATIKNTTNKSFKVLYFRNMAYTMIKKAKRETADNDGKKTKVVQVRDLTRKRALSYSTLKKDRSIVKVKLGKKPLAPGKTIRVRLKVRTSVPHYDGRFGYHKEKAGKLYTLAWCFPYLADYRGGRWTLTPFPGSGENRFSRTAKYNVTIKAPRSYKLATSGSGKTKKGVTKVKAAGLRDFAAVACNYMKKQTATVGGVKIVNWYLPGAYAGRYRQDVMTPAKDAVAYLSAHVGTLPFKELDLVQVFGGFGKQRTDSMEYPGLVALRGDTYYYKSESGKAPAGSLTRTTYHEVAHQWFYAAVGNDEYREPWLDEGLASYCDKWALWKQVTPAVRLLAKVQGRDVSDYLAAQRSSFRSSIANAETSVKSCKLNRAYNAFESYFSTVYSTSVWFLVQLQDAVGEDVFEAILKDYYKSYRLKEATTADFLRIVRAHAAASEVDALISKYFL